jgi:hypothetical protein
LHVCYWYYLAPAVATKKLPAKLQMILLIAYPSGTMVILYGLKFNGGFIAQLAVTN